MNDEEFIELLMKNSLKKQDQAVNDLKKDMSDLRKNVERSFDIDIPKPSQRSTLLVHPDDIKKRNEYYDSRHYHKKHYH